MDFKAYDKNGNLISSKEIALYLEDIGVLGIGYRCGGVSTATHMDINYRTKKWFGDEAKSMSASIGNSFYDYLNVKYATKTVKVNSKLKIRKEPNIKGKVAKKVKNGTKLKVANTEKIKRDGYTWVRVKIDDNHYWAAEEFLK